jgi:hypothetical protein
LPFAELLAYCTRTHYNKAMKLPSLLLSTLFSLLLACNLAFASPAAAVAGKQPKAVRLAVPFGDAASTQKLVTGVEETSNYVSRIL